MIYEIMQTLSHLTEILKQKIIYWILADGIRANDNAKEKVIQMQHLILLTTIQLRLDWKMLYICCELLDGESNITPYTACFEALIVDILSKNSLHDTS